MVSGKGGDELEWLFEQFECDEELINRYDPSRKMNREQRYTEWLVDFYTKIYIRAINMEITDRDTIMIEGFYLARLCRCSKMSAII